MFDLLKMEVSKCLKMPKPVYRSNWDAPYTHAEWSKEGWFFTHVVRVYQIPSLIHTNLYVCVFVQSPRRLMVNLQKFFEAHKIRVEETMYWSGNETAGAE